MNTYPMNPLTVGQANFNPYYTPIQTPVVPNYPVIQQPAPHMEIQRVNGKDSAYAFPMGPNSSTILVDNQAPKIYVVTTDSSGFKAVTPLKVIPDDEEQPQVQTQEAVEVKQPEPNPEIKALQDRIDKLEERMSSYGQSNSKPAYQNKSGNGNSQPNDRYGSGGKGSSDNNKSNGTE